MNSNKEEDLELNKNNTVISKTSYECLKIEMIEGLENIEDDKFNMLEK